MDHLAEYLEDLRESDAWSGLPEIRWIPPHRWHITLAFLGHIDERLTPRVRIALADLAERRPIVAPLQLKDLGRFSTVLWVGVQPTQRLSPADRLARSVQRELRHVGVPIERRPWRAHLTVARIRGAQPAGVLPTLPQYIGPPWSVQDIQLVQSIVGPNPSYRIIEHYALSG